MESKFRVNTNGERSTEEETPATAFRRGGEPSSQMQSSSSSSSQFQPDSQRTDEQLANLSKLDFDLQTLNSSFGNLSFNDSTVRQNGNPLNHNLYNQPINGGAGSGGGGRSGGFSFRPPPSEYQPYFERLRMSQRLSYQNDCTHGSYDSNYNGYLYENPQDVSYPSRNQNPREAMNGFGYGTNQSWRNNGGFGYNQDPSSSMESENRSLLFWAKDKLLSEQLKDRIKKSSKEMFDKIYNNLVFHVCELMVDPFGQGVILDLLPKCNKEQIILIVDIVTQHQFQFVNICFDILGTRAIQLLLERIEKVSEDLVLRIVGVILGIALQLARNINGKHVIIQCFKVFKLPQFRILLEVIAQNCYHLAIDQHGCCLLQQSLHINCEDLRRRLTGEIIANSLKLCLNNYGNYVVQYILEMNSPHVTQLLAGQLVGNYGYLSRNKYGSHVVQKLLKMSNLDSRLIVNDLLFEIDALLLDPFGNYVIQTAWFVSKDDVRLALRWHIQHNIRLMRCSKFGKKVLEKLNL